MGRKLSFDDVKYYIENESGSGCKLISKEYNGNEELLNIVDENGHEFFKSFHAFKAGQQTCPKCSLERRVNLSRLSFENVYNEIKDRNCKLLSETYSDTHSELEILFSCGHIGFRNLADFRGSRPFCADCAPNQKLTYEYVKSFFSENGYVLISKKWNTTKEPIEFKDSVGYKYSVTFGAFQAMVKRGGSCERFGKTNPYTIPNIKLWIKENKKKYKYVEGEFLDVLTKSLTFKCLVCGCNWLTSFSLLSFAGDRCPKCAMVLSGQKASETRAIGNSLSEFFPEIANEWDYSRNEKTPDKYAVQSNIKVWWVCKECGNPFYSRIQDRTLNQSGCPDCSSPRGEDLISYLLTSWGFACQEDFIPQARFKDCRNIKPLPFDFYLPNHNLCIEFHGGQHYFAVEYFGGDKAFKEQQKRDKIKEDYCYSNGINLLVIPYWDFDNIESILSEALGIA